ncbi:MAG: hypothetical protein ABI547_07480 [Betaproteobacteria bacterium]
MNAQNFFFANTKRYFKEFGPGHHIAGLIVLVVVATFGSLQFFHPGSHAATFDFAQQQQQANDAPVLFEYFPAQFVNQATQPEKPIETF